MHFSTLGSYQKQIYPTSLCRIWPTSASFVQQAITQHSIKYEYPCCTPTTRRQASQRKSPSPCVFCRCSGSTWQTLAPSRKTPTTPRTWRERTAKTVWITAHLRDPLSVDVSIAEGGSARTCSSGVNVPLWYSYTLSDSLSLHSGWPLWCSPMCQWWYLQSYWSDWLLMCLWWKLGWNSVWRWDSYFICNTVLVLLKCPSVPRQSQLDYSTELAWFNLHSYSRFTISSPVWQLHSALITWVKLGTINLHMIRLPFDATTHMRACCFKYLLVRLSAKCTRYILGQEIVKWLY